MKKLAQYKKIYSMILIEFLLYIALVIFNFAIRIESTYLLFLPEWDISRYFQLHIRYSHINITSELWHHF